MPDDVKPADGVKPQVKIYSTPTCVYCRMAKEFFGANNISFVDYNVAEDAEKRDEMIKRSGQFGVPVIDIDGELTVGFDKARIMKLLGLSS